LFQHGRFNGADTGKVALALAGYGLGLPGLVAIKVLAPGYYASLDIKTPVKLSISALVITQLLNALFVPWLAHAGLTLSIGLAALINASWLLTGLIRRRSYVPAKGWTRFIVQVVIATAVMTGFLVWLGGRIDWLHITSWSRVLWLAIAIIAAAVLYFGALLACGVRVRELLRR
jgi:putative peptidoglycan lipid II flippase